MPINYSIVEKAGKNFEVTNHENGKKAIVSVKTTSERTALFQSLETAGFSKTQRASIYTELYKEEIQPEKTITKLQDVL